MSRPEGATPSLAEARPAYDDDFFVWTQRTAALLRAGRFDEIDVEHLAEEVADMGRRDRREVASRLRVLVAHLLKCTYQPERRSTSWDATIVSQRADIEEVLADSPSLRNRCDEELHRVYPAARVQAAKDTGLPVEHLPVDCPWTAEQVLDPGFWPR